MKKTIFILMMLVLCITTNAQEMLNKKASFDNGWKKYVIAERTDDNPLVNKQFLQGTLTHHQLSRALQMPYVDTTVKVYDAAGLLSQNEITQLQNRIKQFINDNNVDMVIVTTNQNPCKDDNNNATENFAMDFYEYNNFGKGEQTKDGYDGAILIIDMKNRYFSILDIGEPNNKYMVAKLYHEEYVNSMTPDIKAQNYYKAINYFINKYDEDLNLMKKASHFLPNNNDPYKGEFFGGKISAQQLKEMIGGSFGFGLIISLIMLFLKKGNYKNIRTATAAGSYVKENSFNLTINEDNYIRTEKSRVYSPEPKEREEREHRSYSSYNSDSGSHSSSSGRSFGGGGGSF